MKRQTARWVRKAEDDYGGAQEMAAGKPPRRDLVCFHCQQAAEKYLKALLQEFGVAVPRTHDLYELLKLLLPHNPTLATLGRGLRSLTRYAVEYRYPGQHATSRQMRSALRICQGVRHELRSRLGLAS